jgi:hypothetical protein
LQLIIYICNIQDLTRAQFFTLMNSVFYEALTEILNGNGLLHPMKFTYQFLKNSGELEIPSMTSLKGYNVYLYKCY